LRKAGVKPKTASGRAITIADIAREAGVHPASVSRALRGIGGKVSEATRQRIERVAREMGYLPNAVAASLRTKQSKLVGVLVPDLGNPLFGPLVTGIEVELRSRGLHVPGGAHHGLAGRPQRPGRGARASPGERPADPGGRDRRCAARHRAALRLPTVLVNRGFGDRRFSSVVNDDQESVRLVLDHLVALGHRRIAHVAGPAGSSTGRGRREAFESLCRKRKARGAGRSGERLHPRGGPWRRRPGCSTDRSPRPRSSRRTT
jgi:LacI family transcriptional regulator